MCTRTLKLLCVIQAARTILKNKELVIYKKNLNNLKVRIEKHAKNSCKTWDSKWACLSSKLHWKD